ncbi:zinc finger BED domain-containing protein RICESLEEPER 2-like [Apium graveolens]|uniref:zinc finger BED domain-containing protein RICESLEEPER 2-like n=1 Tax=Apium graveolens TaxID=4045 RepID=UPI003D7B433D
MIMQYAVEHRLDINCWSYVTKVWKMGFSAAFSVQFSCFVFILHRLKMSGLVGKGKKGKRMSRVEIISENAEYEEQEHMERSLGDETPSDDTGEQEEISSRKRKKPEIIQIPDASSKEKQRKKKSASWQYLVEYEENGEKWVRCKLCQTPIKRDKTSSTKQMNRHVDKCKVIHGIVKQTQLQFQKSENTSEKISRATVKADCVTTYEIEKKKLKKVFKFVKKINITTYMWTSSNQKIGYMVVTSHWIDLEWKLTMRVLNFCNVLPPHTGYIIAETLSRCFNKWGIDEKIRTIVVDNAKANDVALRNLNDTFSVRNSLPVGEKIVPRAIIRDGVKYVAASEGRRNKFVEISTQLHLKCKKLILDVSTRWNSTYNMLQSPLEFKRVFSRYAESDTGFVTYDPEDHDREKVEWVCSILGAFNEVTKIVSGTQYPTANMFLSEVKMVKHILDKRALDPNLHIRMMTEAMKEKFDKYWGECNLVMSIGVVLNLRFKLKLPTFCFPTLYPKEGESDRNLSYLSNVLNELYQEYVTADKANKKEEVGESSSQLSSSDFDFNDDPSDTPQGLNDYESFICDSGAIHEPLKSELDDYLGEKIIFSSSKNFDVLSWWKGNSVKYLILSTMARDILSIPMSTVASESTFSACGRVIEPHCSCLKPHTVEMLLCGADWARELYGLKKVNQPNQETLKAIEIDLYPSSVTS